MRRSTIGNAKNQLSRLLAAVRAGESVLILDRNRPIARLEPVGEGESGELPEPIARLEREGRLRAAAVTRALGRLDALRAAWHEVLPSDAVREQARRLLRAHPLHAADALQLAAAVVASGQRPSSLPVVCFDDRLADAAQREGFAVEPAR